MEVDRYHNVLDNEVGYARGTLLRNREDEYKRARHAAALIRQRFRAHGAPNVFNFTGHQLGFTLDDRATAAYTDEATGPALFFPELERLAMAHLDARPGDAVAVFNRTAAGIIAVTCALCREGTTVVSVVPHARSHPSVRRGAANARAGFVEVSSPEELERALAAGGVSLVVVTGVTSELAVMTGDVFVDAITTAKRFGRTVLVDDAYGARLRPVVYGQPPALCAGADLVITSNQKAGLSGPRAGVLAGCAALVQAALAAGMESGQEARGPLALGVLGALERYRPDDLLSEVAAGESLTSALVERLAGVPVAATPLGPMIREEDVLALLLRRASLSAADITVVPAEATAALGMLLLQRDGILTVNAQGMPGARVSVRLKAMGQEVARFGGAGAVARAVDESLDVLAGLITAPDSMSRVIFGEESLPTTKVAPPCASV